MTLQKIFGEKRWYQFASIFVSLSRTGKRFILVWHSLANSSIHFSMCRFYLLHSIVIFSEMICLNIWNNKWTFCYSFKNGLNGLWTTLSSKCIMFRSNNDFSSFIYLTIIGIETQGELECRVPGCACICMRQRGREELSLRNPLEKYSDPANEFSVRLQHNANGLTRSSVVSEANSIFLIIISKSESSEDGHPMSDMLAVARFDVCIARALH